MTTPPDAAGNLPEIDAELVAAICTPATAAATVGEQVAALRAANLDSAGGLRALLAYAQAHVGQNPQLSRRVAQICAAVAPEAGAAEVVPLACYFQAQTHAMNGEFPTAYALIEEARAGFEAQGDQGGALRTNLGLMNVLGEMGRHAEAVAAGERALAGLAPQLTAEGEGAAQARAMAAGVQANLGICFSQIGRFDAALDAYAAAEEHYAAMDMAEREAVVTNNRGVTLLYLGRVREAIARFEAAADARAQADLPVLRAQSLANLGEAWLLLGDYGQALQTLEAARTVLLGFPAAADLLIVTRKLGDAYLALNLLDESLEMYGAAQGLATTLEMRHQHGWVLWGLGAALARTERTAEAGSALAQAAELFADIENRPLLSSVHLEQAALLQAQDDLPGAQAMAQRAWSLVADSEWRVQQAYAALRLADLSPDDAAQAGQWLATARRVVGELDLPYLGYRIDARAGRLALDGGDFAAAETLLLAAVETLETLRGSVAQEALRTSFLQDKTAVYADLLRLYLARGGENDDLAAFQVVERTQSRVLVELLQGLVQRQIAIGDADRQELAALQADLDALYNRLLEGNSGSTERGSASAAVVALEQSIRRVRLRAALRGDAAIGEAGEIAEGTGRSEHEPAAGRGPEIVDVAQLRAGLGDAGALVAFFILDDEIGAFVLDAHRLHVARDLASVAAVQAWLARLEIQWARFRMGTPFVEAHLRRLEQSAQRVLGELYQLLWQPLETYLGRQVRPITLIPQGILHQVPFHALYADADAADADPADINSAGADYLLARHTFTYAPSATVHLHCQTRTRADLTRALVVGVADPQLPFVAVEAARVATLFDHATRLPAGGATLPALRQALATAADAAQPDGVVHLACHGLFRADNPVYSALKLDDGWLTAVEILTLPLAGALVVLSACESGRSRVVPGNELLGIPRAVLGAGARTTVVSQWVVQDEAAAQLMEVFYGEWQATHDAPGALCTAQRKLAETHPHPYYWAAFMVMGAG
ncbi:MAG: CHAT domain-containing protein [Litorilinea sp.]